MATKAVRAPYGALLSERATRVAVRLLEQGEAKPRSVRLREQVAADTQLLRTNGYGKEAARAS